MNGFLVSLFNDNVVMNASNFDKLPPDPQDILIEESAKHELEALRLAAIQNEVGIRGLPTSTSREPPDSSGRLHGFPVGRGTRSWQDGPGVSLRTDMG